MPSLYLIQWGIVGFFVAIHFLIGFLRGSSKSTYFTIVSLILTVVTLWLVSRISLNFIFNNFITIDSLITLVQGYTGNAIPQEFIVYILNPTLLAFVIAIIDLVIRIVAFILIYPFLKWSLTMIIFRPIWKRGIKKALLKKQNEKEQTKFEEDPKNKKKFVKSRKLNKPILGRLFGASMGALRGFVVGFVFLIPVLVISGFVSGISAINLSQDGTTTLGSDPQEIIAIPNEVMDILANIEEMNEKGLGALTRQIVINGKSIDRLIFDMVFTTQVVDSGELVGEISLGQEFESIIGIAQILIQGGYLEDDFNFETISSDNLEDVEQIMGLLGKSTLLQSMIPVATSFGVSSFLPDYINGVNLYDRPSTADALDNFTSIDWENEFNNFYGIIEAVLEFGSVSELIAYADDPLLLLELSPEEAQKFTDIIRAFGKLETLYLLNVAADFATSYTAVQDLITWVDPSEREAYLQDKLAFILDNPNFFITTTNEDDEVVEGEIGRIADFIEAIYSDAYGEVDVRALFESIDTPAEFVELQNPDWVGYLIEQLVEIELLIELIPFGVDYGIYNVIGEDLDQEMADNIASALSETEWDAEFINVGEIYRNVLMLGIGSVLGDQPDYYAFIDSVVVDHMDSVRAVIENIFENSQVVNTAIEFATPYLLESFIADEALRNLVSDALISDSESGVVDFSFGAEINRILTIVETIYEFSTTSEIASLSGMTVDEQLNVVASFGALPQASYDTFSEALSSMQLFERIGKSGLEYIVSTREIPQLYIPEEVDLGADLASVFNLVYYAANYLYQESILTPLIEDVDFAPLLADEIFRSYLLPTDLDNHSNFITSNIAHNIKLYGTDVNLSNYITVPTQLADLSPESEEWQSEVSNLLGAVFDLGSFFEGSETISLSARELILLSDDPLQAPITLITQFADEDMTKARQAFGNLDGSLVFRSSISTIIESLGTQSLSFIEGYELTFPAIAMEDGIIKEEMFVELIYGVATLLDGLNQTLGFEKIADFQTNEDNYLYVNAFNQIADEALVDFSSITVLRGIISDLILSDSLQGYVRNTLNNSGTLQVSDQFFTFERENDLLTVEDVSGLFISLKSLQATPEFYYNPGDVLPFISTLDNTKLTGFFDSTIIREIFTQVFTDEGLLSFGVDTVNQMQAIIVLPDDFFSIDEAVMIEDDLIKTEELVNLFIAVQALGLDSAEALSSLNETTFANLVDPASQDLEGKDDLDRVLASHYIYIILDRAFALEGISTFAGTTLGVGTEEDPINLNPPVAIKVNDPLNITEHNRLPKAEFRRLFTSISMLGDTSQLGDPSAVITLMTDMIGRDVDIDSGEDDFDRFLSSDYLYFLIDVVLKNQDMLSVPLIALDNVFPYEGYIKKTEIRDMLNTLIILDITSLDGIDQDSITIQDLQNVLDETNSALVQYLLSQAIIQALDPNDEGIIPVDAYLGDVEDGMLTIEEINAIVDALLILSGDEPDTSLTGLDFAAITVGQVSELSQSESIVIKQLVSDEIKNALDPNDEGKIPDDAYDGTRLSQTEIDSLVVALLVLANQDPDVLVTEISTDVTVGQTIELRDGTGDPLEIRGLDSLIIQQLISDEAITLLGADNIPDEAYFDVEKTRLTVVELGYMIEAIFILANEDLLLLVANLNVDNVTVGQVKDLNELDSNISKKLISSAIIDQLDPNDEGKIPLDAYDLDDPTRLSDEELDAMLVALDILAGYDDDLLVTLISTDVNVGQVVALRDGTGDPLEIRGLDSLIIQQLISDEAIPLLGADNIPDDAYADLGKTRLTVVELGYMVEAIDILANRVEATLVADLNTDEINVGQVKEMNELDSNITKKLISTAIVDQLDPNDEGKIPLDAYDLEDPTKLSDEELDAMVVALDILANYDNDLLVTMISTDVNVGQVVDLRDGTGDPLEVRGLDSLIIQQLISDEAIPLLGTDNIPDESYADLAKTRLTKVELGYMVEAIDILANRVEATLVADLNTNAITVRHVNEMNELESNITKKLISTSIIDQIDPLDEGKIPLGAYDVEDPTRLSDEELDAMVVALEILANHDLDLLVTMISTDVTVAQVSEFKDGTGDPLETKAIDSYTIKQLITDEIEVVITTIPDEAYVTPLDRDLLTDDEITKMIEALEVLAGDSDPTVTYVADLSTDVTIGQVTSLNALDSIITDKLISDSIVDAIDPNDEGKIPNDAYLLDTPGNNLKPAEVSEMIEALRILAGKKTGDLDALTDDIVVANITVDPTIYQVEAMNNLTSSITAKLISDSIIDAIDPNDEGKIPDDAYLLDTPGNNLKPAEVSEMIEALRIFAGKKTGDDNSLTDDTVITGLTVDPTIYQVEAMTLLTSSITTKLISDSIIDAIDPNDEGKIPDIAYIDDTPGNNLKPAEVSEMIEALRILAGKKTGDLDALTDDIVVSGITVDPTIGQVKLLNDLTSSITTKLISDSIIDAVGVGSVPDDAYVLSTPGNLLTAQEVLDMIGALETLAGKEIGDPEDIVDDIKLVDIETRVTVAQTQDLKTNGSKIIKQIISDAIVDMLDPELIPLGAYNTTPGLNRLSDDEIEDMIDSLLILANGDDSVFVDEILFDESTFTITTLKSFPDSLIMNRIISSGLITNMPNIPIESFLETDPLEAEFKLDILRIEINNIFDALTILGVDDPSSADSLGTSQITFGNLDEILLLGTVGSTNEHPEGYSPIINHILSTPMIAAVSRTIGGHNYGIPSTSLVNDNDLLNNEVVSLVDALKLIGNVGEGGGQEDPATTTLFDVSDTLDPSVFGPALLDDLIDLNSLVVYRMISLGIQDANIANSDAYAVDPEFNYDPELPIAPAYEDIKITEMEHLVVSMNILGVVELSDILTQITIVNLQALTPAEIEILVEDGTNGPNTIIYYIISETVDPDNDLFDTLVFFDPFTYPGPADNYYVLDGLSNRIRLKRSSIADALAAL